jgi:hypothetical protein
MDKNLQKLSDDPSILFSLIGKGFRLIRGLICVLILVYVAYKGFMKGNYSMIIFSAIFAYPTYWAIRSIIKEDA